MTILGKYSFANGEQFILEKYPELYHEIEEAITSVDAAKCLTKESKEKTMIGKMLYSPVVFDNPKVDHPSKNVNRICDHFPKKC